MMTKLTTYGAALLVAVLAATAAAQESKTLNGKTETMTVSVEGIERSSREVTVKKPDGTFDVLYMPEGMQRFDTLKIGDKITAKYYETLVVRLAAPGSAPIDTTAAAVTRNADKSGGTGAHQRTITATITQIDPKAPSITVSGPNGWVYSRRVKDTALLAKYKVGDKLDITWTDALVLSIETAK
jgi:Cu/Ag efflux protein CusF